MSRDIEAVPAVMITTPNDPSAVILRTGAAAIGMTIAQARFVSQQMARAADDAEFRIDQYKRLRDERRDERQPRTWSEQAADDAGKPAYGPL